MANTASTWQYVVVTWPLRGFSHVLPQNPEMAIRGSYEAAFNTQRSDHGIRRILISLRKSLALQGTAV